MTFTFLKAMGMDIGKSIIDEKMIYKRVTIL